MARSAWAWLGDMELDDALLGLGAAGIFPSSEPVALGFLVNAAHCTEAGADGGLQASAMYHEKRALLDAFFRGRFFAVLDRFPGAGKGRGWAGELTAEQLEGLGPACGLEDELAAWLEAVAREEPQVLHLLLSGPLLGRGEELCAALAERVLAPAGKRASPAEASPRLVFWAYAGSFNLAHSSERDRESLRRLVEEHKPRVSVIETTLKAGAWVCDVPHPFWASACPTAWSLQDAKCNPAGFDVSTDIQSVNVFLGEYSSHPLEAPRRNLRWIFERIAESQSALESEPDVATSVSKLLQELEVRSLATNLTKMVPPGSSSMAKLREAVATQPEQLDAAYREAVRQLEELQAAAMGGRTHDAAGLVAASQSYADLYRGPAGNFLEAGCIEYFPPEKPYSGPRLDKRCILRCMSQGIFQGGPTADLLVVLALLLFRETMDAPADGVSVDGHTVESGLCCSSLCTAAAQTAEPAEQGLQLPHQTRDLFHLEPSTTMPSHVFVAALRPEVEMNESTKSRLAPLVDLAIDAVLRGGIALQKLAAVPLRSLPLMLVGVKLALVGSHALHVGGLASSEPKAGSCWSAGFSFELCCAPEHGSEGNAECWDEVYTYAVCCAAHGFDPADAGCGSPYFARFRRLVAEYYATGRAQPALIDAFPRVLANFEARLELCAPAALQASLLQMEERASLEPAEATAERALAHAMRVQRAAEGGLLLAADMRDWPLEPGLDRIREASRRRRPGGLPSRPSELALVLSYCAEPLDWMNETFSRGVSRRVDLVLVQKCAGVDGTRAVPQRRHWRSVRALDVEDLPLRADECSAYFGYLAREYEQLPRHMVFIHADAPEHVGGLEHPNIIDDTLRAVLHGVAVPFAHLGSNRVTMAWNPHTMSVLWRGLFESTVVPGPSEVRTYCCSHFVVARERVHLRPQRFYTNALRFITSPESYFYLPAPHGHASAKDMRSRLVCQNMMFVWHVIFGEALDLPHRMFDPQLPLFLKVRNIRTAYMDL